MSKMRVHCFAISLDGYGAGPNQDLRNIDAVKLGYKCAEHVATPSATHVVLSKLRNAV